MYTDEQFYPRWAGELASAKSTVDITYMHGFPPDLNPKKTKKGYYRDFIKVAQHSKATIRRVDRATKENLAWIKKVAKAFDGKPNLSYAVWVGEHRRLAVQTIDEEVTYVVAIGEEETFGIPRDARVRSKDYTRLWRKYYDTMWNDSTNCVRIVSQGRLHQDALDKIEADFRGKS